MQVARLGVFAVFVSCLGIGFVGVVQEPSQARAAVSEGASVVTSEGTTPDEIILERRVIFQGVDGNPAAVEPGSYWVESSEGETLRLIPGSGEALHIVAQSTTHEEDISENIALAEPWEDDEFHIVLMSPQGQSLDAHGSYSGVQSRAARRTITAPAYKARVQTNIRQKASRITSTTGRRLYTSPRMKRPVIGAVCTSSGLQYPHVTAVSPSPSGMMNQEIVIQGLNMNTSCFSVKLGTQILTLTSKTSNEIRARLPNQKMVGDLIVSHGSTSTQFVYQANYEVVGPPVITGVSPQSFARGELVTIHGTDLDQIHPSGRNGKWFVKIHNTSESSYGDTMIEVVGWTVSADKKIVTFNVREVWYITAYQFYKRNPQPNNISGKLRVTQAGSTAMPMVSPGSVSWQYDPGLQVTSVKSATWDANFIIAQSNILQNHVDVTGRGLYGNETTITLGDLPISQVGLDYRGQSGWFRIPYSAQTNPITFRRGNLTALWSSFHVLHGPQFVPNTFNQFGNAQFNGQQRMEIQVGTTYTLQGWELIPTGITGLAYEFVLSGLPSSACQLTLNVLQHTTNNLQFRVDATGEIPASCDSSTLFGGGQNVSNVFLLTAKYGNKSMELLRKPYFLKR